MRKLMITGAVLALGGTALAQDMADPAQASDPAQAETEISVADTFAAMDSDLDGQVTQDEFTAFAGEGTEPQFEAVAGEDGLMTEEELYAFVAAPGGAAGGSR